MPLFAGITFTDPRIDPAFTDPDTFIGAMVSRLLVLAIGLVGLFFLVRLVTAGYTLMNSMGDTGKIQAAQSQLLNALIGLVVVISAYFLGQLLQTILGINIGI